MNEGATERGNDIASAIFKNLGVLWVAAAPASKRPPTATQGAAFQTGGLTRAQCAKLALRFRQMAPNGRLARAQGPPPPKGQARRTKEGWWGRGLLNKL